MRKIPTMFVRDWDGDRRFVTRDITPGCEWVAKGEGVATRKYDGTCVMFDGEQWWARREVKEGKHAPPSFVPVERDDETGKTIGWEPSLQSGFTRWLQEALGDEDEWDAGTYELIGPKVNGNPEREGAHRLVRHSLAMQFGYAPRAFDDLAAWLGDRPFEGIVFHHPDGRMAKIKKRDFPGGRE